MNPDPSKLEPNSKFNDVLQRLLEKQQAVEKRIADALEAQKKADAERAQFKVSKDSERLLKRSDKHAKETFADRLEASAYAKSKAAELAEIKHQTRAEETFKPLINVYSRHLPVRHVTDLSEGDLRRQKEYLQSKRAEKEREEAGELTFQPKLVAAPSRSVTQSLLKVSESNNAMLQSLL